MSDGEEDGVRELGLLAVLVAGSARRDWGSVGAGPPVAILLAGGRGGVCKFLWDLQAAGGDDAAVGTRCAALPASGSLGCRAARGPGDEGWGRAILPLENSAR